MAKYLQRSLVIVVLGTALVGILATIWEGDTHMRVALDQQGGPDAESRSRPDLRRQAAAAHRPGKAPTTAHPGLAGLGAERARIALRIANTGTLEEALAAVTRHRARRAMSMLVIFAERATDPRVRIRALRAMADLFEAKARPFLSAAVGDVAEPIKVRREAARLLGRTGAGADAALDGLIGSDLPPNVRGGAVLGLAELGTGVGAARAFELAAAPDHPMRLEAAEALARMFAPDAARRLAAILIAEATRAPSALAEAARVAACRSLGQARVSEAERPLTRFLETDTSGAVRAAAARALGILGRTSALAAVATAREDLVPEVARAARIAWSRLASVRD